jgi:hypothetical protein
VSPAPPHPSLWTGCADELLGVAQDHRTPRWTRRTSLLQPTHRLGKAAPTPCTRKFLCTYALHDSSPVLRGSDRFPRVGTGGSISMLREVFYGEKKGMNGDVLCPR